MTKTNYANSHGLINLLNRSCAHDIAVLSHYCMKNSYFSQIVSCKNYAREIKVETKIKVEEKSVKSINQIKDSLIEEDQELSDVDSEAESQDEKEEELK